MNYHTPKRPHFETFCPHFAPYFPNFAPYWGGPGPPLVPFFVAPMVAPSIFLKVYGSLYTISIYFFLDKVYDIVLHLFYTSLLVTRTQDTTNLAFGKLNLYL